MSTTRPDESGAFLVHSADFFVRIIFAFAEDLQNCITKLTMILGAPMYSVDRHPEPLSPVRQIDFGFVTNMSRSTLNW